MAKPFKFKNVQVGHIATVLDQAGLEFKATVVNVCQDEAYPIRVKVAKEVTVDRGIDHLGAKCISTFNAGEEITFTKEGWMYDDFTIGRENDLHIIGIKKPWKEFTEGMKLVSGMKVKIEQDGKWIKGVVGLLDDGEVPIKFEEEVVSPGGNLSDNWYYGSNGQFIWSSPAAHLRIRKFK